MRKSPSELFDVIFDVENFLDKEINIVLWLRIERYLKTIPMLNLGNYIHVIETELKTKK